MSDYVVRATTTGQYVKHLRLGAQERVITYGTILDALRLTRGAAEAIADLSVKQGIPAVAVQIEEVWYIQSCGTRLSSIRILARDGNLAVDDLHWTVAFEQAIPFLSKSVAAAVVDLVKDQVDMHVAVVAGIKYSD